MNQLSPLGITHQIQLSSNVLVCGGKSVGDYFSLGQLDTVCSSNRTVANMLTHISFLKYGSCMLPPQVIVLMPRQAFVQAFCH